MLMDLSERQRATLAAAITVLSAVVIFCTFGGMLWLIGEFLSDFAHVFLPLAVAGVIALILKPVFDWFVERLRLPPVVAMAAVFVVLLLPVVGIGWFFGSLIVEQVSELVARFPGWWGSMIEGVQERWPRLRELWQRHDVGDRLRQAATEHGEEVLSGVQSLVETAFAAGAGVFGAVATLLSWAVLPIYIGFFLLIDTDKVSAEWSKTALPFLKPGTRDDVQYLVHEFINIIVAFFRGQLLIAFIQGILFAIGFEIVGLEYGFILGLLLGFLNIIPYLGSMVGLAVALPLGYFQPGGGFFLVLMVMVVFTVVQTVEGYFLTPKIMGSQTGLHPVAIIVAVFFWGSALNGITGLVLAIPLTAFFVVFWRLAQEKYIGELV